VKLGATDYTLALLASLPALVSLVAQVPSALFVERYENRLRPTVIAAGISRSFYMLFAVLILLPLPGPTKALVFVLMYSLMNLPGTVCGVAWTSMMGDMFSSSHPRALLRREEHALHLRLSHCHRSVGSFPRQRPLALNYVLLYVVSFGTVMGSLYYLTKHEDPPVPKDRGTPATGLSAFGRSIADKSFVRFLVAVFAIHTGFHIPASLWTILWVKEMGLSNSWLGAFSIGAGLMSFLTYRSWGRWSEQYGNMKVLVLTALAHMPFPLLYAHLRSPYVYLAINLVGGFAGAGMNLSLFNALLDVSPKEGRPAYVALYNITTGFSGFVWPFFGVWMYRTMGLTSALDFSAVARIIGMGLAFVLVSRGQKVPGESRPERAS
jgi:hypothetical protein